VESARTKGGETSVRKKKRKAYLNLTNERGKKATGGLAFAHWRKKRLWERKGGKRSSSVFSKKCCMVRLSRRGGGQLNLFEQCKKGKGKKRSFLRRTRGKKGQCRMTSEWQEKVVDVPWKVGSCGAGKRGKGFF